MCRTGDISNPAPQKFGIGVPEIYDSAATRQYLSNEANHRYLSLCVLTDRFAYRRGKPDSGCSQWFTIFPDPRSIDTSSEGASLVPIERLIHPPIAFDSETLMERGVIPSTDYLNLISTQRPDEDRTRASEDRKRNKKFLDDSDQQYRDSRDSIFSLPDLPAGVPWGVIGYGALALMAYALFRS